MYLVLTAMLALNVSTDLLNGFTLVDNSLHSSIAASDTRNAKLYATSKRLMLTTRRRRKSGSIRRGSTKTRRLAL